jgi:acyl carrier protein
MFDKIKKILSKEYGINDLSPEMNFKTDLGLNSFDLMNLLCIAEEEFDIEIEEEDYRHLSTVGEMCTLLEKITGEKR